MESVELSVRHLSFGYKSVPVLDDVSFRLTSGSYICVLGKNGAGKSTLFKCILGLLKDCKGEILINRKNVKEMSGRELASSIAYIPQSHESAFSFSVLDMVMMGTTASFSLFSTPGKRQREIALHALKMLNMESFAHRPCSQLSGGEQQMVLIARALAQNARILLMDEPCANLDYGNQIRVMEKLKKLSHEGYLIIQSTHSPDHAFLFADQVLVLHDGQTNPPDAPENVLTAEMLETVYRIPVQLHTFPGTQTTVCVPTITFIQENSPDHGHFTGK